MVYVQTRIKLENEVYKILRDFVIETNNRILTRRSDLVVIKRKKERNDDLSTNGFCRSSGPQSKNKRKQRDRKILELSLSSKKKKVWNMRMTGIPIEVCTLRTVPKGLKKKTGGIISEKQSMPLYQAYGCKERTKHKVANQMTRRQVKILTTVLTKKQNVQIIVWVNIRMCVKLRSKMFGL